MFSANWVLIRLIKPLIHHEAGVLWMTVMLLFQLFQSAVMAGISVVFVKDVGFNFSKVLKAFFPNGFRQEMLLKRKFTF